MTNTALAVPFIRPRNVQYKVGFSGHNGEAQQTGVHTVRCVGGVWGVCVSGVQSRESVCERVIEAWLVLKEVATTSSV